MISSGLEELASASAVSTLSELGERERERERERESIYIILNIRLGRKEERGGLLLLLLLSGSCHSFVGVTQIQLATVNSQVPPASQSQAGKGRFGAMLSCLRCVGVISLCQKVAFDKQLLLA